MNFKKKALEPLIATILLIVVAVILVTIVLAWGRNFTGEGLNRAARVMEDNCSTATINLSNCEYENIDGNITFFLKNTSNTHVFVANDFRANIVDDANSLNYAMDQALTTSSLDSGATAIVSRTTGVKRATRVKVSVRSITCPNIAFSEITCS